MSFLETSAAALERAVFRHRPLVLLLFVAATLWLGWHAANTRVDAAFAKQLPTGHEYIDTFLKHQADFGGANRVVVALLRTDGGTLFDERFFTLLRRATDEVFFLPGVDRGQVTSLFTPNTRYVEVVEGGLAGGNVVPDDFRPDAAGFARVRENLLKSGRVGQIVARDFSGALVSAQLLEIDPGTGERLDYAQAAAALESLRGRLRAEAGDLPVEVSIIGFAKLVGDIRAGAVQVALFFGVSFAITALFVALYAHSFWLTLWPVVCSLVAVLWQLGLLHALGFGIDPYSILVPFLIFAIGVSHAVQMVRSFRQEIFLHRTPLEAAARGFRQLLLPGTVALTTDTLGFVTLFLIKIPSIQELALTASLGVGLIVLTNLFLLPVLLSYTRLPARYADAVAARRRRTDKLWHAVARLTRPQPSLVILVVAAGLGVWGYRESQKVKIGDLQAGAPELRADSRYNRDVRAIREKFSVGSDLFSVIVETPPNGCVDVRIMTLIDDLDWRLRNTPGVQGTVSLPGVAKVLNAGWNEGSLKWRVLPNDPRALAQAVSPVETSSGLLNADGSAMPVLAFLENHKAETLAGVVRAVREFRREHTLPGVEVRLASGNAGVMAATNEVVESAQYPILLWVYGAVIALCWLTFRSLRATLCIVLPLALVSSLGYALMVALEIGLKPSTLPVVSLGVGIGVDYGIYLFSRLHGLLRVGRSFEEAMRETFSHTGSAVVFTGLTLAVGVAAWGFSPLKFQADMGLLLAFLFAVNMLAAVIVLPALARWLWRR